jgi:hypothetical protein
MQYWAFLSYSHADVHIAAKLMNAVESYRIPKPLIGRHTPHGPIPARIKPLFRDRDELGCASDLGQRLAGALEESRFLIVLCSPQASDSEYVNREIRTFRKVRAPDSVIAVIVRGNPESTPSCFPAALREPGPDGQPIEPLAADLRSGKDGSRLALLKIVAAMINVSLDELAQRDQARKRRLVQLRCGLGVCAALLAAVLYIGLADAGVSVPRSHRIQRWLDRHDLSVFRQLQARETIALSLQAMRRQLVDAVLHNRAPDGSTYNSIGPKRTDATGPWITAQSLAALCRSRAPLHAPRVVAAGFESMRTSLCRAEDGRVLGWRSMPGDPVNGIIALWYCTAIAEQMHSLSLHSGDAALRAESSWHLFEQLLDRFKVSGSPRWHMYAENFDPENYDQYTTVLAIQALMAEHNLRPAAQDRIRPLIRSAADHLIKSYVVDGERAGWTHQPRLSSNTGFEINESELHDGLTLQIYAVLLRAQKHVNASVPRRLLNNAGRHLAQCAERTYEFDGGRAEFHYRLSPLPGSGSAEPKVQREAIGFLWYSWAIECAGLWLEWARSVDVPREDVVAVERALGHIAVDMKADILAGDLDNYTFRAAEMLYCISAPELMNLNVDHGVTPTSGK